MEFIIHLMAETWSLWRGLYVLHSETTFATLLSYAVLSITTVAFVSCYII